MSRNYYSEINLHMVWHTKESTPLLIPKVETIVHHEIRDRCIKTPGVFIHEVGGTETHVHVCVSIVPTVTISELIGQLKGGSAHDANQKLGRKLVEWQTGYGVVSFGTRDLEWVMSHVKNQRDRHGRGQIENRLERITTPTDPAEAEQREAP